MPKFVEEIIENLDTDADIENLLWINIAFENPNFLDFSEEEFLIPDAYAPEKILTM